jgi:hypothetical protein
MVCPPNCRIAISKLTRVLNDGFSNIRANAFLSSRESHPCAFISTVSDISNRISSLLRSETESRSFPAKSTSYIAYSISRNDNYSIEAVITSRNSFQQREVKPFPIKTGTLAGFTPEKLKNFKKFMPKVLTD